MGQYKRLGKNIFSQTIGKFASKLLVFLMVPLYTSVLTTTEYGTVDYINISVTLLYPLLTLIIAEAEVRYLLDIEKDKKEVFTISLFVGFLGIIGMFLLSFFLIKLPVISEWYIYFAFLLSARILYEILSHFAIGINKFNIIAVAGVINTLINVATALIFLVVFQWGISGYLLSYILGDICSSIYIIFKGHVFKYIINPFKINLFLLKQMVCFSIPLIPNSLSWWVNNSADKYILEFYHGLSEMGILSIAYKIPSMLTTFVSIFISAWRVSSVEDFGSKKNKEFFLSIHHCFCMLLTCSAALLMLFSKEIAFLIFQKDFFIAWKLVPILIYAFVFQGMASFLGTIYLAEKKTNLIFLSTMFGAILNIGLNIILAPLYGAFGVAIATVLGYYGIYFLRFYKSRKIILLNDWKSEYINYFILFVLLIFSYTNLIYRIIAGGLGIICLLFIHKNTIRFFVKHIGVLIKKYC